MKLLFFNDYRMGVLKGDRVVIRQAEDILACTPASR